MFVLAWTSGHTPARTMYFYESATGWGATEDVAQAKQFKSKNDAIQMWRSKHAWPDDEIYQQAWKRGSIRVERADQKGLLL